jgi:hypothetical protein
MKKPAATKTISNKAAAAKRICCARLGITKGIEGAVETKLVATTGSLVDRFKDIGVARCDADSAVIIQVRRGMESKKSRVFTGQFGP